MKRFITIFSIIFLLIISYSIVDLAYISQNTYAFEFFNKRHFGSFTRKGKILDKHGYFRLNRAEENMMRKTEHININNKDVFYNDSLFDNNTKDAFGMTNCMRMLNGKAPIAKDGIELPLHHLQQRNDGIIVETDTTYHRKHTKELHSYKKESEIDRRSFEDWKRGYWRERGAMRCK